jgi:hypothetical protein
LPIGTSVIAAKANVTAETLIGKAEAIYRCAMDSRQLGAGVAAVKEMGVLSGVRIERAEIGAPGESTISVTLNWSGC